MKAAVRALEAGIAYIANKRYEEIAGLPWPRIYSAAANGILPQIHCGKLFFLLFVRLLYTAF
jgi:hypothetical protein